MSRLRVPIDPELREDWYQIVRLTKKNPRTSDSERYLARVIGRLLDAIEEAEKEGTSEPRR